MRAARIHDYNSAPVVENVPTPEIGPADALVRVAAASLNPLDVKLQQGSMHHFFPLSFPYSQGTDLAGTIEKVGSDVTIWREGDEVVTRLDPTKGGAFAKFAAVSASYLVKSPATVSSSRLPASARPGRPPGRPFSRWLT